jgi:hypothetical protein
VVGEALEDLVELPGGLARGDHRGKDWTEDGGLCRERVCQTRATLYFATHPPQRVAHSLIAQVLGGESQGTVERHAGA